MIAPFIIDRIRRDRETREDRREQPALPVGPPPDYYPPPPPAHDDEAEKRGVAIIDFTI